MVGVVNSKASQPTSFRKIKVGKEFHSEDIFRSMIALMLFYIALFKASQKFLSN